MTLVLMFLDVDPCEKTLHESQNLSAVLGRFFQAEPFPSPVFSNSRGDGKQWFPPPVTPALSSDARPRGPGPGAMSWKPRLLFQSGLETIENTGGLLTALDNDFHWSVSLYVWEILGLAK